MLDGLVTIASVASAVGSGLVAGVLFAFSVSVLPALRAQPARTGITVMQGANAAIETPTFLVLFVGTAASCLVLAATAPFADTPAIALREVGALLFVLGCIGPTATVNGPLNAVLAATDASSADGARVWAEFLRRWSVWNDVRTVAAVAACVALTIGLVQ